MNPKTVLLIKRIAFGILGAYIGSMPNIYLKSFPLALFGILGTESILFYTSILGLDIGLTIFGFVAGYGLEIYLYLIGGAIAGYAGAYFNYLNSYKSSYIEFEEWKETSFWASFFGGFVFNLVFIVYAVGMPS